VAVKKGQEFFISYGPGYWKWNAKEEKRKTMNRKHRAKQ
jgi:hypothetical protein